MVYRGGAKRRAERHRPDGVVEDMVRQFADPYAFVRELVQNAIDAGATRIKVRIEHDERMHGRTSVEDDGSGMSLAIIEGPLLTLFSSSKEGVAGKIGRYGVGFMSVFAIEPTEVLVDTWNETGHHLVRLRRDHSYEVVALAPKEGNGTIVTLVHDGSALEEHAGRVQTAVSRWCRHVELPIEIDSLGSVMSVQRGFDLLATCVVEGESDGIRAVVGYTAGTSLLSAVEEPVEGRGDYAGFFGRGLTLHETTDPEHVETGLRFKVESSRLSHTLSRDDVRRDDTYAEARRLVSSLARRLPAELARVHGEAVRAVCDDRDEARYVATLAAALEHLGPAKAEVPLLHAIAGARVIALEKVAESKYVLFAASTETARSRAVAARGMIVLRSRRGTSEVLGKALAHVGRTISDLAAVTVVAPFDAASLGAGDLALLDAVARALRAAGWSGAEVVFARFDRPDTPREGSREEAPSCATLDREGPRPWALVGARPRGEWSNDTTLALDASHLAVSKARAFAARAASDRGPTLDAVAAVLARIVRLDLVGPIDKGANESLLAFAAGATHGY